MSQGSDWAMLDTLKKRFRIIGDHKSRVQVQTTSRLETMTATQEWRFKELQGFRFRERDAGQSAPANRAWYTLVDAGERLATSADRLLSAAVAGKLACYVATDGLRGRWGANDAATRTGGWTRADFSHLRLTREACRDIEAYGSSNVTVLKHPTAESKGARFLLEEPLWVSPERILLKHPLPAAGKNR